MAFPLFGHTPDADTAHGGVDRLRVARRRASACVSLSDKSAGGYANPANADQESWERRRVAEGLMIR
jgi:hypothetical protein